MAETAVVTVQVGQCGNQLGPTLLSTLLAEASRDSELLEQTRECFFRASSASASSVLTARAVLVDTEAKVVDAAFRAQRSGCCWAYGARERCAVIAANGAANNFACGYNGAALGGERPWAAADAAVRREAERADSIGGVLLIGSAAGGTGSGVCAALCERIRDELPRAPLLALSVWPHATGEVVLQNYNACLALSHIARAADGVLLVENDAARALCCGSPALAAAAASASAVCTLRTMNTAIASQLCGAFLPCARGDSPRLLAPVRGMLGHLCCHSGLPLFSVVSAPPPLATAAAAASTTDSWLGLVRRVRQLSGSDGVAFARLLTLRGPGLLEADFRPLQDAALYARWMPSPAKQLLVATHAQGLGGYSRSATLASNSRAVVSPLSRVLGRAQAMFQARAFFHHLQRFGMEEADFEDALLRVEQLVCNYRELLS